MPDVVEQFRDALTGRGIVPGQILADGKLHRADAEGRGGKGDAAYLLHLDGVPAGGFQNWRDGLGWQDWRADVGRELTSGEDAAHRRHLKSARSMQKREDARRRAEAAAKAEAIWFEASPGTDHPYRCQKGVKSYGLRLSRGKLVIPVRDVEGRLQSLQFIDRTGSKKFLTGGKVQGGFFIIGELANVILIGEGYATCASGHAATPPWSPSIAAT
jgi:putative DNA primase/helicase